MQTMKLLVLVLVFTLLVGASSWAVGLDGVPSLQARSLNQVELLSFQALDGEALAEEDAWREEEGLPYRFALPLDVNLSTGNSGNWEKLSNGRDLWRLRIGCEDALSLNLVFSGFSLPQGASLLVYASDKTGPVLQFDSGDNRPSGRLGTPLLLTDELVLELEVTSAQHEEVFLEVGLVGHGYRGFGENISDKSGTCNIDVVCPEGDDWRGEIASVAKYTFEGGYSCTGVMINNTAEDQRPLFLTANHCSVDDDNIDTVIVYWNFQSPVCGAQSGGQLNQFSYADTLLASYSTSDFKLLELQEIPDPAFGVTYAGWDRSGDVPASAVAIHQPSGDEKSISFEDDALHLTTYLSTVVPGNETHLMVTNWDLGTTEPGSSGSPLFDPNHRIVGQLHGGYAACNDPRPDWYGRFFISWEGGGTPETRLKDHLDPTDSGVMAVNRFGSVDPDPDPEPEPLPVGEMSLNFVSVIPNPFRIVTELTYQLNQAGLVRIRIFDVRGHLVHDLGTFNGNVDESSVAWDGLDQNSRPVAAGVYIIELEADGKQSRRKVVRLR